MQNEHLIKAMYGARILSEETKAFHSNIADTSPLLAAMLESVQSKATKIREELKEVHQILERGNLCTTQL